SIHRFSSPSQLSIKFREHQLFASDAGEFQVVAKTFLYYGTLYNPSRLDYDIALVELSAPVTITGPSYIRPACLIAQGFDVNAFIGVPIGWGVHRSQSPVLRETRVSILNRAKCLLSGGDPSSTHICGYTKANGICYGDSGGPLTVYSSGKHYLAGVTSGTRGNREQNICSTDWPQYYTQATLLEETVANYTQGWVDQSAAPMRPLVSGESKRTKVEGYEEKRDFILDISQTFNCLVAAGYKILEDGDLLDSVLGKVPLNCAQIFLDYYLPKEQHLLNLAFWIEKKLLSNKCLDLLPDNKSIHHQPPVGQFMVAHPPVVKPRSVQLPARAVLGLANPQPTKLVWSPNCWGTQTIS
ncbi:unnamed protein product, partial [Notodromas monacha]